MGKYYSVESHDFGEEFQNIHRSFISTNIFIKSSSKPITSLMFSGFAKPNIQHKAQSSLAYKHRNTPFRRFQIYLLIPSTDEIFARNQKSGLRAKDNSFSTI